MQIAVPSQHLQIHLDHWLYHLRTARAHMEHRATQLDWQDGDAHVLALLNDLLGACEDASSYVRTSVFPEGPGASPEAGLGKDRG